MKYDIIVIGSGPAGLSAALTARARNKTVLVAGNRWQDSPLARAERVDNYLGLPHQSGAELLEQFHDHAKEMGVEFLEGRALSALAWEGFQVSVGSQVVSGGALILAPGVVRQQKFPGEAEYLGRGVSYCATCDGMLYRGKSVVVVGRSPDAPEEANFLKNLGCQVTYLAPRRPETLEADIPFVKTGTVEIQGELTVTGLIANGETIPCAGVFILRPAVAPTDLLPTLETENGIVKTDRTMATNLPGVFAAGDCTGGPLQVAKAAGEGQVAALSACAYLDEQGKAE
jgi:thioredoxin reductase (NADPH)